MKEQFMRAAIRLSLSKMRTGCGGPFGAVVVRNGKIIGRGWNQVTSANDPTAHAEVTAIRDACGRLKTFQLDDCEIYTSCEPCPMCLAAIYWAHLRKVYYANTRKDAAKTVSYTHLRAHETRHDLVCRLLLEKKKKKK